MKITMIGAGYVGLVSGICFSDFGHEVVCVDNNPDRVRDLQKGFVPIYEPGLDDLLARNVEAGRLSFSDDLAASVRGASAVFIGVGTPSAGEDGRADLTYVYAAARDLAQVIEAGTVVVTKSTVPVGTNREIYRLISELNPELNFSVASNPEFLREGSAIVDFMKPDRVVVGVDDERAESVLQEIYQPLSRLDFPVVVTDIESAELIKYAANAFLATKIGFINEMSALCEALGADVGSVAKGMGMDSRIGEKFLRAGPGYGGSCFPKDTRALAHMGRDAGAPIEIVETVIRRNEEQKLRMVDKIVKAAGGDLAGKKVAVLGVTFKPETDDMRDAPSLTILPELHRLGAQIVITDPQGEKYGAGLFDYASWAGDAYEASEGADVLVVMTEWKQFKSIDLKAIAIRMRTPAIADLRGIFSSSQVISADFTYHSAVGQRKVQ
jgi:UDPglucose 6-dehydrogenase